MHSIDMHIIELSCTQTHTRLQLYIWQVILLLKYIDFLPHAQLFYHSHWPMCCLASSMPVLALYCSNNVYKLHCCRGWNLPLNRKMNTFNYLNPRPSTPYRLDLVSQKNSWNTNSHLLSELSCLVKEMKKRKKNRNDIKELSSWLVLR
jgi:hypothetical protein